MAKIEPKENELLERIDELTKALSQAQAANASFAHLTQVLSAYFDKPQVSAEDVDAFVKTFIAMQRRLDKPQFSYSVVRTSTRAEDSQGRAEYLQSLLNDGFEIVTANRFSDYAGTAVEYVLRKRKEPVEE